MEGWRHTNFVDSATSVSSEAEAEAEGEGQGQVKGEGTLTKKSGNVLRVGIFLDFAWLTTRTPMGVHRTCGEPDEIELTAMGVKLNGSRCRQRQRRWRGGRAGCHWALVTARRVTERYHTCKEWNGGNG